MPVITETNVSGGAHGWNIDIDVELNGSNSVLISVVYSADDGKVCSGRVCICTLLGPEGPERSGYGLVGLFLWTFFCLYLLVAGEGTARTLRTTQWTRAS